MFSCEFVAVEKIESLNHELQRALLAHLELPAQTRVKTDVIGANAGVASNTGGRSVVLCRSLLTLVPASKLKGCELL